MDNKKYWIKLRLYSGVSQTKRKFKELYGEEPNLIVNYEELFQHLGFPNGDLKDFEIDHIIPISYFMNGNPERLKEAWHPKNLRWLDKSMNRNKRDYINTELEIELFNKTKLGIS